jgi:hypothetical protein
MFNTLDKFKNSFDKLSFNEKEELKAIHLQTEKYISKNRFNEALDYLKSKLNEFQNVSGLMFIENIKSEIVKTYNEYIIYLINQPGKDSKNNQHIKKLFNECDYFISNNIKSYLLKQNNYACFLSQNGHSKQAVKLQMKLHKIDILNYLNNENQKNENKNDSELSIIAKDYSNLSSLNNNIKNHYDALIASMESLAITQFDKAFNCGDNKNKDYLNNINRNLCFNYYSLGVQQEYLKRNNDSLNSFASAKLYIPQQSGKNKNNNEYAFIKRIHIPKSDANTCVINFREGLNLAGSGS